MTSRIQILEIVGPLAVMVALAFDIAHIPTSRLPQAVQGSDVLSVVFGDAKKVISAAMLQKADSYFHGGGGHGCRSRVRDAPP